MFTATPSPSRSDDIHMLETFWKQLLTTSTAADVTASEVGSMREQVELARVRSRTVFAVIYENLGGLALGVWGLLAGTALAGLMATSEGFPGWGLPLALGLSPVWALWTLHALRAQAVQAGVSEILEATTPLSNQARACHLALQLVGEFDVARALRDTVVARGEELLSFHLRAMESLIHEQRIAAREAENRRRCRELHGLTPAQLATT